MFACKVAQGIPYNMSLNCHIICAESIDLFYISIVLCILKPLSLCMSKILHHKMKIRTEMLILAENIYCYFKMNVTGYIKKRVSKIVWLISHQI
jgi:hypothetical protein